MRSPFSILLAGTALCILAACQRAAEPVAARDQGDFDWARAALGRNPQLEIVAADSDAKVFTVRNKHSGEVLALQLDEIVAAPVSQLQPAPATPAAAATASAAAAPSAPPSPVAAAAPEPAAPADKARTEQTVAQQSAPASSPAGETPSYTIERADGQLRVSGPGVSIVSSGQPAGPRAPSGQRAVDPIICEGRRMIQLDNRDIYVEGDAIVARGGCELYITNSRVVGSSTGVVVQDAVVHIANSDIEGATASFVADERAKLFIRNSTFQGLSRRAEGATVQDQGGNRWR